MPPPRRDWRSAALRADERLAALLSGRDVALTAERLALRARSDVRAGRTRDAALLVGVVLDVAVSELGPWSDRGDLGARLTELRSLREGVAEVADRALGGGLDPDEEAVVERALGRVEAALRARAAAGFD